MSAAGGRRSLALGVVGLGRMGRLVREIALERGHQVPLALGAADNREGAGLSPSALRGLDVVVELTTPAAAALNVRRCLEAGVSVACGTTGWARPELTTELGALAASRGAGLLVAPNFAIGVLLFRRIVRRAAELVADDEAFDAWIEESHHRGKADWPSGTALALAADVLERLPRKTAVRRGAPDGPARPEELLVSSARGGFEPGLHRVVVDAADETIELVHRARSRRVFAAGAVRAAEWLAGRTGLVALDEMIDGRTHLPEDPA